MIFPFEATMSANPFRDCLAGLDEAEDAYFRREGLDAFAEWAKAHAGLLRGAMAMLADEVDEVRRMALADDQRAAGSTAL